MGTMALNPVGNLQGAGIGLAIAGGLCLAVMGLVYFNLPQDRDFLRLDVVVVGGSLSIGLTFSGVKRMQGPRDHAPEDISSRPHSARGTFANELARLSALMIVGGLLIAGGVSLVTGESFISILIVTSYTLAFVCVVMAILDSLPARFSVVGRTSLNWPVYAVFASALVAIGVLLTFGI
jgi:hypothetical protein